MKKIVLYAIEAEWTSGWRYDDWAADNQKDTRDALKRRKINDPATNYRIAKYVRAEVQR
jgi:hypothetical protein